jgi:hypothetical protein
MEIYLLDGNLKVGSFIVELSSDVDVGRPGAHGPARHQATLHQLVRIMPHDLSVLKVKRFLFLIISYLSERGWGPKDVSLHSVPSYQALRNAPRFRLHESKRFRCVYRSEV